MLASKMIYIARIKVWLYFKSYVAENTVPLGIHRGFGVTKWYNLNLVYALKN